MSKFLLIQDQHSKIFGHRILNSQLSFIIGIFQLFVCLWSLGQHVYSMIFLDQILYCDFSSNSTLPPIFTGVDAIIFDVGLFHSLWGISGCVAEHLDGGYGRFGWCITHTFSLIFCLPFAFITRPKPYFLWPLLLYIYWHWYWHVEEMWNSARKIRLNQHQSSHNLRTSTAATVNNSTSGFHIFTKAVTGLNNNDDDLIFTNLTINTASKMKNEPNTDSFNDQKNVYKTNELSPEKTSTGSIEESIYLNKTKKCSKSTNVMAPNYVNSLQESLHLSMLPPKNEMIPDSASHLRRLHFHKRQEYSPNSSYRTNSESSITSQSSYGEICKMTQKAILQQRPYKIKNCMSLEENSIDSLTKKNLAQKNFENYNFNPINHHYIGRQSQSIYPLQNCVPKAFAPDTRKASLIHINNYSEPYTIFYRPLNTINIHQSYSSFPSNSSLLYNHSATSSKKPLNNTQIYNNSEIVKTKNLLRYYNFENSKCKGSSCSRSSFHNYLDDGKKSFPMSYYPNSRINPFNYSFTTFS